MLKLKILLTCLSFSLILSFVYDSSNCSYSADDSTCSNCIPYNYLITPDGSCSSCESAFPNCQYCGENGCEQCNSGFNLVSYDDNQYIVCESYSTCKQYNFFYSRFGQKLKYCSMLANDSKTTTILIILLAIFISLVLLISLVIIIVFLIKKYKGPVIASNIIERHTKCSLCYKEKDENTEQVNTLPCGGFICINCESKAKECLSTGEYNKCLTCKKLVTWYAYNNIELQVQNQDVLNTDERLNPIQVKNDDGGLAVPNKIEISNNGVCVVCLKSEPLPCAVIPCVNKPKHKLHESCLGEYYKNYYKGNKREVLFCPICRTEVDI